MREAQGPEFAGASDAGGPDHTWRNTAVRLEILLLAFFDKGPAGTVCELTILVEALWCRAGEQALESHLGSNVTIDTCGFLKKLLKLLNLSFIMSEIGRSSNYLVVLLRRFHAW